MEGWDNKEDKKVKSKMYGSVRKDLREGGGELKNHRGGWSAKLKIWSWKVKTENNMNQNGVRNWNG